MGGKKPAIIGIIHDWELSEKIGKYLRGKKVEGFIEYFALVDCSNFVCPLRIHLSLQEGDYDTNPQAYCRNHDWIAQYDNIESSLGKRSLTKKERAELEERLRGLKICPRMKEPVEYKPK